jgi:hypothetical protein
MLVPTITERTLKNWRGEALNEIRFIKTKAVDYAQIVKENTIQQRILRLTQELLDQHLLRKEKKK